jgi:hypothetical protein
MFVRTSLLTSLVLCSVLFTGVAFAQNYGPFCDQGCVLDGKSDYIALPPDLPSAGDFTMSAQILLDPHQNPARYNALWSNGYDFLLIVRDTSYDIRFDGHTHRIKGGVHNFSGLHTVTLSRTGSIASLFQDDVLLGSWKVINVAEPFGSSDLGADVPDTRFWFKGEIRNFTVSVP